ncbi:oligosaccharide flippase family protein [Sulfurimonas sp.]|uniref:oligosaccharide flippase family protein n=1 Tax=Sulfurimonas sp. TaxID=2022749 RepID=UPI0019EEA76E|nr:oligosaccharide flippase family protein [Sulfurimonas sp.]MBE0515559.1 oligosaccharide flippase family protein [Sulfurimonas sp.]
MFSKKYINTIATTYLQMFVQIIIPLLLIPYMVEKLQEDLYGLWILFTTLIGYFGLTGFGFGTTFLKEVSKQDDAKYISRYLNSTLFFYLAISALVIFVFLYLLVNLETIFLIRSVLLFEAKVAFSIFFIVFFINFISSLFGTLLFAKDMLYIHNYILIVNSVITAVLMFVALYFGHMLITLALINLFMSIASAIYIYYMANKKITFTISLRYFDLSLLKEMLKPSMHYFIITASAMIILSSDNIVISSLIGVGSVTVYAIGYKLVAISQSLLFRIVDIMIPDIARLDKEGKYKEILKLHNKTLLFSLILGFAGYGFLFIYGSTILEWWVGPKYVLDENILRIFIAFGMLHTGVHVSAVFIVAMGAHRETSYMTMLDAFLNVFFSVILLQYYGLLGVAMGTFLAHLLTSSWFTSWWFYKQIDVKLEENAKIVV